MPSRPAALICALALLGTGAPTSAHAADQDTGSTLTSVARYVVRADGKPVKVTIRHVTNPGWP